MDNVYNESKLTSRQIKDISEEVIVFIKEKTKSKKRYILHMVLDQAKIDVTVKNILKHNPKNWQGDPRVDEC